MLTGKKTGWIHQLFVAKLTHVLLSGRCPEAKAKNFRAEVASLARWVGRVVT